MSKPELDQRPVTDESLSPTIELHARNLYDPSHMAWTNDGRLLVAEHSAGQIKDITDGGDMKHADPVATGMECPAGILPLDDGRILVADVWEGKIYDISEGGDVSNSEPFAEGLSMPYSLARWTIDGEEHIIVSCVEGGKIAWGDDITDGGGPEDHTRLIQDCPARPGGLAGVSPIAEGDTAWQDQWEDYSLAACYSTTWYDGYENRLFAAVGSMGQIFDLTDVKEPTPWSELVKGDNLIAWDLSRVGGERYNPEDELLYAVEPLEGAVVAVDPDEPMNYRFAPRVVQGLTLPSCLRFSQDNQSMYVCGMGEGVIWEVTDFR
jgi:hypothetical protein